MDKELLKSLLESAVDAILTINERGIILSVNPAAERMFSFAKEEMLGQNIHILMPSPYREQHDGYLANYSRTRQPKIIGIGREVVGKRKDGTVFPAHLAVSEAVSGNEKRFIGIIRDISDLKQAQEELLATYENLEASEARHRGILETAAVGILTTDEEGRIELANRCIANILGTDQEALKGRRLAECVSPIYRSVVQDQLAAIVSAEDALSFHEEMIALRKDGTSCPVTLTMNRVELPDRRLVTAIIKDISPRRDLEKDVLRAADEERQRIAQDLHDGLASHLTGVDLVCQLMVERTTGSQKATVQQIQSLIGEAIQQTRHVAKGLYPVDDDGEGLMNALRRLALDTCQNLKLDCRFQCSEPILLDDNAKATHLFRIAQEALTNALKHGEAQSIVITLSSDEGEYLCLQIEDNGLGFATKLHETTGIGLRTMRYRASILHGTLKVGSTPRGGVKVVCRVPLASSRARDVARELS